MVLHVATQLQMYVGIIMYITILANFCIIRPLPIMLIRRCFSCTVGCVLLQYQPPMLITSSIMSMLMILKQLAGYGLSLRVFKFCDVSV